MTFAHENVSDVTPFAHGTYSVVYKSRGAVGNRYVYKACIGYSYPHATTLQSAVPKKSVNTRVHSIDCCDYVEALVLERAAESENVDDKQNFLVRLRRTLVDTTVNGIMYPLVFQLDRAVCTLYTALFTDGEKISAKKVAFQILSALNFLHVRLGVSHGDLKADNVLVMADKTCRLADFGLSRFINHSHNGYESLCYTFARRPPEVFAELTNDPKLFLNHQRDFEPRSVYARGLQKFDGGNKEDDSDDVSDDDDTWAATPQLQLQASVGSPTGPLANPSLPVSRLHCDETLDDADDLIQCHQRLLSPERPRVAQHGTVAASADVFAFGSMMLTVLGSGENAIQNQSIEFTKSAYDEEEQHRAQLVFWYCALVDLQQSDSWKRSFNFENIARDFSSRHAAKIRLPLFNVSTAYGGDDELLAFLTGCFQFQPSRRLDCRQLLRLPYVCDNVGDGGGAVDATSCVGEKRKRADGAQSESKKQKKDATTSVPMAAALSNLLPVDAEATCLTVFGTSDRQRAYVDLIVSRCNITQTCQNPLLFAASVIASLQDADGLVTENDVLCHHSQCEFLYDTVEPDASLQETRRFVAEQRVMLARKQRFGVTTFALLIHLAINESGQSVSDVPALVRSTRSVLYDPKFAHPAHAVGCALGLLQTHRLHNAEKHLRKALCCTKEFVSDWARQIAESQQ